MLNYIYSIILGATQGLTEFLPISSSAHLLILHYFLEFEQANSLSFDAALHLGTFFALLIYFWPEVKSYAGGFFRSFENWNLKEDLNQRLAWFLILGSIPAALAGWFGEEIIENTLRHLGVVVFTLIFVALLFFIVEKWPRKSLDLSNLKAGQVLLIGFFQALALIPGVSRSGITIVGGMSLKLKRVEAAKFSFLLGMPIILGAGVKKVIDIAAQGLNLEDFLIMFLGFITAFVFGWLAIKYFLKFVENHGLQVFAIYRIILALILLVYLILK